jgi:hypothetical protein
MIFGTAEPADRVVLVNISETPPIVTVVFVAVELVPLEV